MAKIPEGLLGAFIGKVGPVTGYVRNGQNIVRIARTRSDGKITPARSAQRAKIKVCNEFTQAFSGTGFFKRTFPTDGSTGTGYNRACSAIMNLSITGKFPYTSLNYSRILVSRGMLPPAPSARAGLTPASNILFQWDDTYDDGTAKKSDKVILVAYFSQLKQAIFTIGQASRNDGTCILNTQQMKGFTAETWIGFLNDDEKNASNSTYTGTVDL